MSLSAFGSLCRNLSLPAICLSIACVASAQTPNIVNSGFEQGFEGWSIAADAQPGVTLSAGAKKGKKAAVILGETGFIEQDITVEANGHYELTVQAKGAALLGVKLGDRIYFDKQPKKHGWKKMTVRFNTDAATSAKIFVGYNGGTSSYDNFSLKYVGVQGDQKVSANVVPNAGGSGLSAGLAPGQNFDLLGWKLSVPTDTDGNGKSDDILERELASGYQDKNYFFTGPDGGMVFKSPNRGARTSKNTKYVRSELREMLRRGDTSIKTKTKSGRPNKNGWVFSSAPKSAQKAAGAVDGVMEATLAVNRVTTTGKDYQIGRVIIGQIHAKNDEPIRLYYRKLPGNSLGAIYAAHESREFEKDVYYEMIGTRSKSAPNPKNGIGLNEKFTYKIDAKGNSLHVTITKLGQVLAETTIDMTNSGYDIADDYMYFKAGVYNQNNSGDDDDYVQATFYDLKVSHDKYQGN